MCFKNKSLVTIFSATIIIASISFSVVTPTKAIATTNSAFALSTSTSALNLGQLQEIINSLQQQIQQLMTLVQQYISGTNNTNTTNYKPNGQSCTKNNECASGNCTTGKTCCEAGYCGWDYYPNTQCVANGEQKSNEYANVVCRSGQWKVINNGIGCNMFPCDSGTCVNNKCSGQCIPNCANKSCGENDGCGNRCTTGTCQTGYTCNSNGQCVKINPSCTPNCSGKACGADNGCGSPCTTGTCQTGYTCNSNGQCVASCTNTCTSGAKQCNGNGYQTCSDTNGDGCTEWGEITNCPSGQTCSGAGICSNPNTSTTGTTTCQSLNYTCGYPKDAAGQVLDCGRCEYGKTCVKGKCQATVLNSEGKECFTFNNCSSGTSGPAIGSSSYYKRFICNNKDMEIYPAWSVVKGSGQNGTMTCCGTPVDVATQEVKDAGCSTQLNCGKCQCPSGYFSWAETNGFKGAVMDTTIAHCTVQCESCCWKNNTKEWCTTYDTPSSTVCYKYYQ